MACISSRSFSADGCSPGFAAATGLIGVTQVATRVVVTVASDCCPHVLLAAAIFALQAAAVLILLVCRQPGVILAVLLLGDGRGAVRVMRATLVAERYGRVHDGVIGGALALFVSGATALAPVGAGGAYRLVGRYGAVFVSLSVVSLLAALAMAGMRRWG